MPIPLNFKNFKVFAIDGGIVMTLGEYIDKLRRRHKIGSRVLSKSQMAIDAGLGVSTIQQIIGGYTSASPTVLKQISDTWGDPDGSDYYNMMKLAGHPVPEAPTLTEREKALLDHYRALSPDNRDIFYNVLVETNGVTLTNEQADRLRQMAMTPEGLNLEMLREINRTFVRVVGLMLSMPERKRYEFLLKQMAELLTNTEGDSLEPPDT